MLKSLLSLQTGTLAGGMLDHKGTGKAQGTFRTLQQFAILFGKLQLTITTEDNYLRHLSGQMPRIPVPIHPLARTTWGSR